MGHKQRLYIIGMALAFLLFVLGELIWLPDPFRLGGQLFWIDAIDLLVYLVAAVPCIWLIAAIMGLFEASRAIRPRTASWGSWTPGGTDRWAVLRCLAVALVSAAAAAAIIFAPTRLVWSLGLFGAAWLLLFADMIWSERSIRRFPRNSLLTALAAIALLAGLFWPTSYMVTYPGLTMNMNRYVQVEGGTGHTSIAGVLVFERPAFPADWLYAKLFPHYEFKPREDLGMTLGEYDDLVRVMKQDANTVGSAIAFGKLGIGSGVTSKGVRIVAVMKDSPVQGVLKAGDIIVEVDGKAVSSLQELQERMSGTEPGQAVSVTVLRDGKKVTADANTRANPDDAKRAAFGIQVQDELAYDVPKKVNYRDYLLHEGGPSHGAMLALTLIDQLTPGGVTNGNRIAGTGTIEPDGSIGKIGGIEQKAYTVRRSGADVFFVPAGQEEAARLGASDLQIVPVRTLDDILAWLKAHPKSSNGDRT
ncbi:PDZ domain-containing protein [Paenibacillus contaminans]|uniref:PDZ domain-containing protein n=1 Tax=Paenibacillus contaminans TaxID=450362 RepID=A0A329MQ93_9BACL|nr:PDZ domain-containing protein [Paenibacillus contaminans]RAV20097.1 hypothetical protein DQG23_16635 [Paenibacillus contaminans]